MINPLPQVRPILDNENNGQAEIPTVFLDYNLGLIGNVGNLYGVLEITDFMDQ